MKTRNVQLKGVGDNGDEEDKLEPNQKGHTLFPTEWGRSRKKGRAKGMERGEGGAAGDRRGPYSD